VRGFLASAASGDVKQAWHTIRDHNPLPGVCGRVCYHPCESNCNRAGLDGAVSVHDVERAIADEARSRRLRPRPAPITLPPRLVAVVGSGPAGLSAAYQLARRGCGVTVFDAMPRPGGMLRYGIPAFRLPRQILDAEIALLHQMGIHFVCRTRVGAEIAALGSFDAVLLAVGRWRSRPAGLPGEGLPGVRPAVTFLREINGGLLERMSGPIVVIGGGDTAVDAARVARRLGGDPTVVYRRSRADMPSHPDEADRAEAEGVRFVLHAAPLRFIERSGRLAAVEFQRTRPGRTEAGGLGLPEPIPGATFTLPAAVALTALGEELERDAVQALLDATATRLQADGWGRTRFPTVFAGGDAATGAGTVAEAIGSGRRAAEAILALFRGQEPVNGRGGRRTTADDLNLAYFPSVPRHAPRTSVGADACARTFDEVVCGLDWTGAQAEATRCFRCGLCTQCDVCVNACPNRAVRHDATSGAYGVDLDRCQGCGTCAEACPTGALVIEPEILR
jgi:NADPH-dependent glutamate synthase beta subunit-like oxidoreductase